MTNLGIRTLLRRLTVRVFTLYLLAVVANTRGW